EDAADDSRHDEADPDDHRREGDKQSGRRRRERVSEHCGEERPIDQGRCYRRREGWLGHLSSRLREVAQDDRHRHARRCKEDRARIYTLDGDTLKLCLSIDPDKVAERPKEFSTKEGEMRVIVTFKRQTDPPAKKP